MTTKIITGEIMNATSTEKVNYTIYIVQDSYVDLFNHPTGGDVGAIKNDFGGEWYGRPVAYSSVNFAKRAAKMMASSAVGHGRVRAIINEGPDGKYQLMVQYAD